MPKGTTEVDQPSLLEARVTTAPCVPAIRKELADWRKKKYKGATDVTRTLMNYWFSTDHRLADGRRFSYYYSQREAIEALVYVFEIEGVRRHKDLLERFAPNIPGIHVLQQDLFPRFAVKMATGSGKTKVMSLAVAWQFFNAIVEGKEEYSPTTVLLAPNVIVFERLRADFAGGRIFRLDPVIPPELEIYWDFECYMRGESERAGSVGALYVTNIQQLYERADRSSRDEPEELTAVLGPRPSSDASEMDDFAARVATRDVGCLVINDEGHHTHDEENEWNQVIRRLHAVTPRGLGGQLDFSATPRYGKGGLFTWTIYDYPLKQAIIDGAVKRPMKGLTAGIRDQPSDVASVRYRAYLTAGVERWREYREQLAPLGKKPILFVMMNSTAEADDVADYLRVKYPAEFGADDVGESQLLVIHTDRSGEVSKKDLESARDVARRVDEGESPVNAIVSVLMLREGWDVQNVTVIVGLRPYTSKANILPEQTIGRGLRLMFADLAKDYAERIDVIGNSAFLKFVEQLEREEDITLGTFDLKEPLVIQSIEVDIEKLEHDISLPALSPILARKKSLADEIASLDISSFEHPILPRKEGDSTAQKFHYEGVDIITLQKLVEREYSIPEPQTAEEVISYYAKRIAQDVKLPTQFAALVPKVREFLATKAFGDEVDLREQAVIRAIATSVAQYVTVKTFASALRALVIEELAPSMEGEGRRLSQTPPFPFSRPTFPAKKTVFNLVAADNEFERDFARFLEKAVDVVSFAKLPKQFGFSIEYADNAGNLRLYEPDFAAIDRDGVHFIIETKGREDLEVAHKDRAARIWCENATLLSDTGWRYIKVPQAEFSKLQPADLSEVALAFQA
jgi:type III restriction enzyme